MRVLIISILVSLLLFITVVLNCQNTPIFKTGDRVCFVGNSITHSGEFHRNILLYHTTRFPDVQFKIFNCGVAGDKAVSITNRMDSDILVHKPNIAVLMIGMNDVNSQTDLLTYETNLEPVIVKLLSKGITVLLQKPTIYDESTVNSTAVKTGKNLALKAAGDVVQKLATKYNLKTVDYWQIMNDVNNTIHQTDPAVSILRTDRVHPISTGHLVMAYQFIQSQSTPLPQIVSNMVIDTDNASSQLQSANCVISNVTIRNGTVSFTALEKSLPFPVFAEQQPALGYVPFTRDLNSEMLQVKNLPSGTYAVKVDNYVIGNFTGEALQNGINIAEIINTPQYQQAENVRLTLNKLWEMESYLRGISYVTFTYLTNYSGDKNDVVAVKNYLDNLYSSGYASTYAYLKSQIEVYVKYKNVEKNLYVSSDSLRNEAYKAATPVSHTFKIYPAIPVSSNNVIKDNSFDLILNNTYNPPITDYGWSSPSNFNAGEFISTKITDTDGTSFYRCTTSLAKDDYNHALVQYTSKTISPGKYKMTFRSRADAGGYYLKMSTKTAVSTFLPANLSESTNGITLSANKIYITPTTEWQSYSCVFDLNFSAADYLRVYFQFHNKGTYDIDDVQLYPYSSTSISDVRKNLSIFARNGSICLSGDVPLSSLEIYSVTGVLLQRINIQHHREFPIRHGIYIVKYIDINSIFRVEKIIV